MTSALTCGNYIPSGWEVSTTSTCGSYSLCGGKCNFGKGTTLDYTYTGIPTHSKLKLKFFFV